MHWACVCIWCLVSVGSGGSGRLVNLLRAGIAAVAGICPMVGAVIVVGMGRQEFVITYGMWLVGVYSNYQCRSLCLRCP